MPQKWITKKNKHGENRHIPIRDGAQRRQRDITPENRLKKNGQLNVQGLSEKEVVNLIEKWIDENFSDASAFAHSAEFHYIIIQNNDTVDFENSRDWDAHSTYAEQNGWTPVGELWIEANNDWDSEDHIYLDVKYRLEYKNLKDAYEYTLDLNE